MAFKDYYEVLGLASGASQDDIKHAYRRLARKYHPDVSTASDAEARFKEVGEAYAVLKDPEKRAAYDDVVARGESGPGFQPPPGWDAGFEFSGRDFDFGPGMDQGDLLDALFRQQARGGQRPGMRARGQAHGQAHGQVHGQDHHARVMINLADAYRGAQRSISLRVPVLGPQGQVTMREHTLDVSIPKGIRAGQHLRLAGQGAPGAGGEPAGDLYLEVNFNPDPVFRVDGRDVYLDLPLAPWEAALGASVTVPTPEGPVQLTIPPNSTAGRQLRLKGRGIPGSPPGNLYAIVKIALPPADSDAAREAYRAMAKRFAFDPRKQLGGNVA
jgi:curved DNA-binding protein